ncbi:MAG: hypothetical protein D6718_08900 [Acidobacteria bacterium]|nr:MAG: hypothetical protein D6718_08900 [Acidobacteriota bacterium]
MFPRRTTALLAALAIAAPAAAPASGMRPPTPEERDALRAKRGLRTAAEAAADSAKLANQDLFDVQRYDLRIVFNPNTRRINGQVTVTAQSLADGLDQVMLDLLDNMNVDGVDSGGVPLAFDHQGGVLTVTLDRPYGAGEVFAFTVSYAGEPDPGGTGYFGWNKFLQGGYGKMAWSLSEPDGARGWWPCKDRPDDKAMVDERWTVPAPWVATGNGVLAGTDPGTPGWIEYHWVPSHPLTTYLVSIAATDYVSFSDTYDTLSGGTMPIDYYVYPGDLADAQESFKNTPAMIRYYAETFGEYPFVEDKYGMSAFPFSGAMEHTTNTSYGYTLIDGTHRYDYIIAHELSHQWWGDSVSPETWADVWLNEGFATYSEALWEEHLNGWPGYHDYMNSLWREHFDGPVYDPTALFGSTVYDKGAWVLHMLRHVMGPQAFFDGLRAWYADHKDGVGNTAQFQANMETFHGAGLGWFFDEWVYGENSPRYEYGWSTADLGDGTYRTYVRIHQVQTDAGVFTMPVDLTLVLPSGDEVRTVWNDAWDQDFTLDSSEPPSDVLFDRDDWILKASVTTITLDDADGDGVPDRNDNCPAAANPAQADFDGDGTGDACDADDDGDRLDDAADCAPFDPEQGRPDEVYPLSARRGPAGATHLEWAAAARADDYDVVRGTGAGLRAGDYGGCRARGLTGLSYDDPDLPPAGEMFTYLVRGHDTGCGGDGPLGDASDGSPRDAPCAP